MATFVLTAIGDDQAGLVEALSGVVATHDGNWNRSQMAGLAGKFAGIVEITVADARIDDFLDDLEPLEEKGLLDIQIERARDEDVAASPAIERYALEVVGTDQPGIVHEISAALADLDINFEELATFTESAPMAGGTIFKATAVLVSPPSMSLDDTRSALEDVADDLRLDVDLQLIES